MGNRIMDWRLDPTREQEYRRAQQAYNKQQLDLLAQRGAIEAEGIENLGDAASSAVTGGVQGYFKGKKSAEDSAAHDRRMALSEEDLKTAQADRAFWDAPMTKAPADPNFRGPPSPIAEEGPAKTRRQAKAEMEMAKAEEELNGLRKRNSGTDAGMTPYQREMVALAKLREERAAREGGAGGGKPTLVTYTDESGNAVQEFVTPKAGQKFSAKPATKSPGEDTLDREFAKDYNDWESGGKASSSTNLKLLEDSKAELAAMTAKGQDPRGVTGRATGRFPDEMKDEKAVAIRNKVRAAAQGALKAALGTSFTEAEGLRIMNNAYDENLSPAENMAKIDSAVNEIKQKTASMEGRAGHFRQSKGTLAGYDPNKASRKEVRRQTSSKGRTKIIYDDGSEEIIGGQ